MSKVIIGQGIKVNRGREMEMREKAGGSNVGEYKHVSEQNFAGPEGGAPEGSYPINTEERAKAALAYAHNAPNPEGIKRAVYRKYPSLDPRNK